MWLTVQSGQDLGKRVQVGGDRFVIGRDDTCQLTLRDTKVSRNHASIESLPSGGARIHDLGSTNGTFVNGQRVTDPVALQGGEQIRVGDTVLSASFEGESPSAPPVPSRPRPGTATIERAILRRSVRRATVLAASATVALVLVLVLFLTGVLPPGGQPTVPEIVNGVKPSTVLVLVYRDGKLAGNGSGWMLDASKGLVVTNAHVVDAGTGFAIGVNGERRPATVAGVAPCRDLAVLKVKNTDGLKTLPLGSQSDIVQGDMVVALGYPVNASLEENLVATNGVVSVVRERYAADESYPVDQNVLQTTAQINPGNSGGPLVDSKQRLVGVNTEVFIRNGAVVPGQNYAIGVDLVKQIVPGLSNGRSLGWTGMDLEVDDQGNLVVFDAVPGTPAAEARFDNAGPLQITAINHQSLDHALRSYCDLVGQLGKGSSAVFTVSDGSNEQDVRVAFA